MKVIHVDFTKPKQTEAEVRMQRIRASLEKINKLMQELNDANRDRTETD